jgi:hypothetical protein
MEVIYNLSTQVRSNQIEIKINQTLVAGATYDFVGF